MRRGDELFTPKLTQLERRLEIMDIKKSAYFVSDNSKHSQNTNGNLNQTAKNLHLRKICQGDGILKQVFDENGTVVSMQPTQ